MKLRYTDFILAVIAITAFAIILSFSKWEKSSIKYDAAGYYMPLPAIFIYQDFKSFSFYKQIAGHYQIHGAEAHCTPLKNGNCVMKYSLGTSLIYSPGFFLGHLFVQFTDYPKDGYSPPYILGLSIWLLIFSLMGFIILSRVLLGYFPDHVVSIVLFTLFFCSNLLVYTTYNSFMSHGILFTLYSFYLFSFQKVKDTTEAKWYWIIGLCGGLMVLIRPTEFMALILIIPLHHFKMNWNSSWLNNKIIYALIGAVLIGSIQMIYWQWTTGEPIFYTYGDQGFNFLKARIGEGMFGWKKGWLVYTPSMVLAIAGLVYGIISKQEWSLRLIVFTYAMIHITFSWSELFYGGSLGCRAVVQHYAVLAIPIGLMIQKLWLSKISRFILFIFLSFCFYQNIVITYHSHYPNGIWNANYMEKNIYLDILKYGLYADKESRKYLDSPEKLSKKRIKKQISIYNEKIISKTSNAGGDTIIQNGWIVDTTNTRSSILKLHLPNLQESGIKQLNTWLSIRFGLRIKRNCWTEYKMTSLTIEQRSKGKIESIRRIRLERLVDPKIRKEIELDIPISIDKHIDSAHIYLENFGADHPITIDFLTVHLTEAI